MVANSVSTFLSNVPFLTTTYYIPKLWEPRNPHRHPSGISYKKNDFCYAYLTIFARFIKICGNSIVTGSNTQCQQWCLANLGIFSAQI